VGDALGAPLEGLSAQQIKAHFGRVKNYVDGVQSWKRKPHRWRLKGLYTDDTQQALALCDVLVEHGRVNEKKLADLYLAMAKTTCVDEKIEAGSAPEDQLSDSLDIDDPFTGLFPPIWNKTVSRARSNSPKIERHDGDACPTPEGIIRYVVGLLDDPDRAELDAHLKSCGDCQIEVGALRDAFKTSLRETASNLTESLVVPDRYVLPFAGAHRGIGRSFRRVLAALQSGVPAQLAGRGSDAGIGAAMRIAPVSLYFGDDRDSLFESVMAASLMTHHDIRSLSGAMAVAHTIRRLVAGEPLDPSLLLWVASDLAKDEKRISEEYADVVIKIGEHAGCLSRTIAYTESVLDQPRDRALAALVEEANRHGADPPCKRPTQGFPPVCIPACLYLLMTTDSFEEAVADVVNLGGDADTAGAILGTMAGAYYGVDSIPRRWLENLQNREGIEARALALARGSDAGLQIPDLVQTERQLSLREAAWREDLIGQLTAAGDMGRNRRI
jgi:ADP-ribosylglycohydrolase